ncbi:hypothetical protein [Modestobacter sp. SSW1-42]|uniref:hypothetical protein n=1 Tax=Modestobacter sp. SSW1-42 TaxID=596372 RepID=UPI003986B915
MPRRPLAPARRRPLGVAALAAAALLTGCAGDGTVLDLGDGVTGYVSSEPDGARTAAIVAGTLAVSGGGCLVLDDGAGTRYFLALPYGTRAAPGAVGVTSGTGQVLAVGDQVTGGGGYDEDDDWRDGVSGGGWSDVPGECLAGTSGLAYTYDLARA